MNTPFRPCCHPRVDCADFDCVSARLRLYRCSVYYCTRRHIYGDIFANSASKEVRPVLYIYTIPSSFHQNGDCEKVVPQNRFATLVELPGQSQNRIADELHEQQTQELPQPQLRPSPLCSWRMVGRCCTPPQKKGYWR